MSHTLTHGGQAAGDAPSQGHALLQAAMDAGRLGAWDWDIPGNRVTWTERIYEFHGMAPGSFGGTVEAFAELVHPEDRQSVQAALAQTLERQRPYELEFRTVRPSGEVRWLFTRAEVFCDAAGAPTRLVGITQDITERKRTEQALRASEERLRVAQRYGGIGVWSWEVATGVLTLEPEMEQLHGLEPGTIRSYEEWRAWLHPDDLPLIEADRDQALAEGRPFRVEFRIRHADGGERWLLSRGQGEYTPDGRLVRVLGVNIDITERKRAEQALRESEARLAAFMEHSPGPLFIKDAASRFVVVNHAFLASVDRPSDAVLGGTDYDLFPHEQADVFVAQDQAVRTSGQNRRFEDTFVFQGRRFTFLSHKFPLPGGSVGCIATDITDQKQAEERLRQDEATQRDYAARLQQLNAASLAIHAAPSRDEVLRRITWEARALIGAHQAVTSTTTQHNWTQAINEVSFSDKYAAWRDYSARPDSSGIYELVCRTNTPLRMTQAELEAHPAWCGFGSEAERHPPMRGWLAAPLVGRDGRNIGLIQLSDKETGEFSAADEALLQQLAQMAALALESQTLYAQEQAARAQAEEASRLKDEFLATVSHELRTPLTAFLGYAQLLQTRKRDEAYIARTVAKMVQSAKTQAQLIEDLLDVSRIVSGKLRIEPTPIDLIPVIRAALDTVRTAVEAKELGLEVKLNPAGSRIIGDPNRLQQVIWNLLANAAKFTPAGGMVMVRLEPQGREAVLSVRDTGQGISPAFLPYVFDRFRQADSTSHRFHGGLGLGLAIVRHLVELHGGTVQATSPGEGQGATFTVRLPLAGGDGPPAPAGAQADEEAPAGACPPELRGLRVLIVDDQPAILELLHEILAACGAAVRVCAGAREALETLRTWRPDALVSDIAMPGEDGYWLIGQVRALAPQEGGAVPAVALTAYVRLEDHLRVLEAGFQQYVPKPVEPTVLRAAVAHLARNTGE